MPAQLTPGVRNAWQLPAILNPGGTKRKQKQKAKKKNGKKKGGQNQANGGGVKVLLSRVATLESQLKNARKKTGQAAAGGGAHARGAGTKPARGRKVALPPLVAMAVEAAC